MKTGTTESGFEYNIDEIVLDDMRVMDDIAAISSEENPMAVVSVIDKVLGREQKCKLYQHLETETGRVPIQAVMKELTDIFDGMGTTGKNS